jgi:hypothetical protein
MYSKKLLLVSIISIFCLLIANHADAGIISRPMIHSGLVGYWSFDSEGRSGEVAIDLSGNDNHGALNGLDTPTDWVDSKPGLGTALDFDGSGDYVLIPATSDLDLQDLTIASWNYAENYDANMFMFEKTTNGAVNTQYSLFFNNTGSNSDIYFRTMGLSTSDLAVRDHADGPVDGQWNYIVATYNSATDVKKIYVNGVEIASATGITGTINTNPAGTSWIGTFGAGVGYPFLGKIDETRIYNRALSADEVRRLYTMTNPRVGVIPLDDGLVGYWDFETGRGDTVVYDRTPNRHNGTLTTMDPDTDWVDSKSGLGNALEFDGTSDHIVIPDSPDFDIGADGFSYSAWIKPTAYPLSHNMFMGHHLPYFNVRSTGKLFMSMGAASAQRSITGVTVLSTDTWYHAVGTYDSDGYMRIYLNAEEEVIGGPWPTATNYSYDQYIGRWTSSGSYWFSGSIDEVRMYNRALSAEEIKRLYNVTKPRVNTSKSPGSLSDGLVGHWTFDGNDTASSITNDVSGNGNTGTLTSGPVPAIGKLGQALEFDGVNDYVDAGNDSSVQLVGDMTLSAWVKPNDTSGWESIVSKWGSTWAWGLDISSHRSALYINGWNYADTSVPAGEWSHVSVVYNDADDKVYFYYNGEADGSATQTVNQGTGANVTIGQWSSLYWFSGLIDDARIYNRSLSAEEIKRLYNLGK